MYKESEKKKPYEDEIDLGVVFSKIGAGFNRVIKGMSVILTIIRRRIFLVSFFLMIGIAAGYGAFSITKPYYTSSMTLIMANIRNEFVEDQLNTLAEMVKEENFEAIAGNLNIDLTKASQIRSMEFKNLDQEKIAEDSVAIGSPFRIEMTLYDNKLFAIMQPALVNYMEENPYFARQKSILQRQYQSMISKLKDQITSLDSAKISALNPRGPVNGFVYGEALDPTNLYKEGIKLYEQQVKLEASLEKLDLTQVVSGFYIRSNPSGPSLIKYLFVGGISFFFLGLLIAIKLEKKK